MSAIGIMEGRLSPPVDGRIQAFPIRTWRKEFESARTAGFDCIEWIYDLGGAAENPIASAAGIREMLELSKKVGVGVRSLCADYLMERPMIRVSDANTKESSEVVLWLLAQCHRAAIQRLVLPFVGANAIETQAEIAEVSLRIAELLRFAEKFNVEIHLETSLVPSSYRLLLDTVSHPMVKVTYDIGNSLQFGFAASEEFGAYGRRIGSVHVKDAKRHGTTVRLGRGDADFGYCFRYLASIGYEGDYILQGARVPGVNEVELAEEYCTFVRSHLQGL